MPAISRTASPRSGSFMSGLLRGHPRRCPLGGRCAVWWVHRRGVYPRPLTIYAKSVESVRLSAGSLVRFGSSRRQSRMRLTPPPTQVQAPCHELVYQELVLPIGKEYLPIECGEVPTELAAEVLRYDDSQDVAEREANVLAYPPLAFHIVEIGRASCEGR